ncbi:MAG: hypothetical protein CFE30_19975 [Bradyrhizobium sp. PARBB1]|nr:MAG: hypothetical protein CFE30_19975 [Bradyrhizobium sp. PARBB1]PSO24662.1 hypothetical protein C7G43_19415 [Bradyrhizobium sp. MOS004]HBY31914.1 hypothetical protein [Bradyrhizobium sp.]
MPIASRRRTASGPRSIAAAGAASSIRIPIARSCEGPLFTSPRVRGEVGSHRRCDPGEGESPRESSLTVISEAAPHPNPLPARAGRGSRP